MSTRITQAAEAPTAETTCARCGVTSRWMAGHECADHPPSWAIDGGEAYCLACRRERAGEAGVAAAPDGTASGDLIKARQAAVIAFEIARLPERSNGEIAKAARCSPMAVVKVRKRLEGEARAA
jgi:hypothetical protein